MKKLILPILSFATLLNAYNTYELLPSVHEYKIVIKETEHTTIDGFDSKGRMTTQSFTQSRERYLEPKDAFDLAIRYGNCEILACALNKFKTFNEKVDISSALNMVSIEMQNARSSKKIGYVMCGIFGSFGILPWLHNQGDTKGKIIMSSIIGGFATISALLNHHGFKSTSNRYKNIIHLLLNSPSCTIKDKLTAKKALYQARTLLTERDQLQLNALIS
jgi:hypothetical protein